VEISADILIGGWLAYTSVMWPLALGTREVTITLAMIVAVLFCHRHYSTIVVVVVIVIHLLWSTTSLPAVILAILIIITVIIITSVLMPFTALIPCLVITGVAVRLAFITVMTVSGVGSCIWKTYTVVRRFWPVMTGTVLTGSSIRVFRFVNSLAWSTTVATIIFTSLWKLQTGGQHLDWLVSSTPRYQKIVMEDLG
jgi:hypothetical protein